MRAQIAMQPRSVPSFGAVWIFAVRIVPSTVGHIVASILIALARHARDRVANVVMRAGCMINRVTARAGDATLKRDQLVEQTGMEIL